MNRNTDTIRSLLMWLLQEPGPQNASPSGNAGSLNSTTKRQPNQAGVDVSFSSEGDPVDANNPDSMPFMVNNPELEVSPQQPFHLGEIPVVQDHVHKLLKRRLQAEIAQKPPLFPWETEVRDYPIEYNEQPDTAPLPAQVWLNQLRSLQLPVVLPDLILNQLLANCQALLTEPQKQGVKLVRAVESLFPEQPQTLERVASMVLVAAYRGADTVVQSQLVQMPQGYAAANPQQQMALSMLAAQEILSTLTLTVTPTEPEQVRQWQTSFGPLELRARYQSQPPVSLQIQVHLPCSGRLQLSDQTSQTVAERTDAGSLLVALIDPSPEKGYALEVVLGQTATPPLQFVVQLQAV